MKFVQAKNYSKGSRGPGTITLVCIHTMEAPEGPATAENVAAWFAGANAPQASAHYNVDADSVVQSVLEKDVAWHAGPINGYSIGVEHAGYAKQSPEEWADEYSLRMLERSAELVAGICTRHAIPIERVTAVDLKAGRRAGICGHADVTVGLTGGKGHWDPGPHFPWEWYLGRVVEYAGTMTSIGDIVGPAFGDLVPVVHAGETWLVARTYVAPVGIGQAERLAADMGFELPTPGLVDAIWAAADLKIDASLMVRQHDGTPATMDSVETHADQAVRLGRLVGDRSLRVDFELLAGAFKDVVRVGDRVGLYGWHRANGQVIQPFYAGHAPSWRDYSQGVRLVRRAP